MLLYGNVQNIQDQCVVYNFTSVSEWYQDLKLVPPNSLGASTELDFDMNYYNWIMGDHSRFMIMFSLVQMIKNGQDVYLIISEDQWSEMIVESFLKMLQQRYGINGIRVNCIEDVFTADTGDISTPQTIYNYDQDVELYEELITRYKNTGVSV